MWSFMGIKVYKVHAVWDAEASVFVATSEDIPGLVYEAATWEELVAELRVLIPELLELNAPQKRDGKKREKIKVKLFGEMEEALAVAC